MEIAAIKEKIVPILQKSDVRRASFFGSIARSQAQPDSDVDLLVELNDKASLLDFVNLKYKLEETLKRKVDLVEYGAIKKSIRENVLAGQVKIYPIE
ncbi:MAG: nucleotidyltransferase domain-containing protein [Patescibacteria group bacterium]